MSTKIKALSKPIELSLIVPDNNNVRTEIGDVTELTASIIAVGLLNPILVTHEEGGFRIVCGHRRYAAVNSIVPKPTTIDCIVRDNMTETEIKTAQIAENIQREDITPLEEGKAYLSLLDAGNTMENIAILVGKSTKTIASRLKLNDLIPDFQEMLLRGVIKIKDALELAKLSNENQTMIFDKETTNYNKKKFDWKSKEDFELDYDYYLEDIYASLDNATFDITDPDIIPQAGACTTCIYNSANQPLLFPDEKKTCGNVVCYNAKKNATYEKNMQDVISDPSIIIVGSWYGNPYSKEETIKVKYLDNNGIKVINRRGWEPALDLKHPGDKDTYIKNIIDVLDEDEDIEEAKDEASKEYELELSDYKEQQAEYEERKRNGEIFNAFNISNESYQEVYIAKKSQNDEQLKQVDSKELEIASIISREKRNREIDDNKEFHALFASLKEVFINSKELKHIDKCALVIALCEKCYNTHKTICEALNIKWSYNIGRTSELYDEVSKFGNTKYVFEIAIRSFIINNLYNNNEEYNTSSRMLMIQDTAAQYIPEEKLKLSIEKQEKQIQRLEKVKKKIVHIDPQYPTNAIFSNDAQTNEV